MIARLKHEIKSLTEQVFLDIVLMLTPERDTRKCHVATLEEPMPLLLKYYHGHKHVAVGNMQANLAFHVASLLHFSCGKGYRNDFRNKLR